VLDQVLYNTSKEHFVPILDTLVDLVNGKSESLAIDLLLICCTFKGGMKITNWTTISTSLVSTLNASASTPKQKYFLLATVVARSDPITSQAITKKIFEVFREKQEDQIGTFCLLVGKLNEIYYQKWVLEEFVKYSSHRKHVNIRYINSAQEGMFDNIALTLVAMLPSLLIVPTTGNHERKGRINGYVVAKTSSFMKALMARISNQKIRSTADSLEMWLNLKVVEILGLGSSELEKLATDLLSQAIKDSDNPNASIIGVLLSIISNQDPPTDLNDLLELISSRFEHLASDIGFLEGLEKVLLNKSTLSHIRVPSNSVGYPQL
jgi:hypothetical protein